MRPFCRILQSEAEPDPQTESTVAAAAGPVVAAAAAAAGPVAPDYVAAAAPTAV